MITPINNSPNFKAIYYNRNTMTNAQNKIAERIVRLFNQIDFSDQKSRTFEENYERMGIDFVIKPDFNDFSVNLDAYRTLDDKEKLGKGFTPKGVFSRVGTYNELDTFKIEDVEKTTMPPAPHPELKLFGMMAAVAAIVAMPFITHIHKSINPGYLNSEYFNKLDSVYKADSLAKDTFKMINKIK